MPRWRRLFTFPFRTRRRIAADVDEELAFHLDMRARALEAAGVAAADARARARAEFGDLETTRRLLNAGDERIERRLRLATWAREALQDLRLAWRQALRTRATSGLAVVTLAVGIGASSAIFSVVYGVLLAPLPYPDAAALVVLRQFDRAVGAPVHLAADNFRDWRERARLLAYAAVAEPYGHDLTGFGEPVRLGSWRVTEGFFEALAAPPLLGRLPVAAEYARGGPRVAVLGYGAWRGRFSGDPGVVGRTVTLDGEAATIVGVMGPAFRFPSAADLYVPLPLDAMRDGRAATYLRGIARLRDGVRAAQAQAEADAIAADLGAAYPATNRQMGALVTPLRTYLTGDARGTLLVLLAAVLAVVLVGCANVANLLLARGLARRREFAVRRALGAGRWRLVRQLLIEGATLTLGGLAGGVVIAVGGVALLRRVAPADLPRLEAVQVNAPMLAFAAAVAVVTAVLAGLAPALQQSRAEGRDALRESPASAGPRRRLRAVVVAEVTAAVLLLAAATLLLRSYARLQRQDLGFRPAGTLALTVHVWDRHPDPAGMTAWFGDVTARLAALPGVAGAAAANALPLSREGSEMDPPYLVEGEPVPSVGDEPTALLSIVTPGYFAALGIPVRRGRPFSRADDAAAEWVAVVNEALARRHWPGGEPVGRRIVTVERGRRVPRTVIGVAADVRHQRPDEVPRPEIYVPLDQRPFGSMTILVRAREGGDPAALVPAVRAAIWSVSPDLAFDGGIERLDARLAEVLAPRRFVLGLVTAFAGIALLLAMGGIYGALAFSVHQRAGELGIRMALGSTARQLVALVLREALAMVGAGTALGLAATWAMGRGLRSQLYGISPADPATAALIGVAMLAAALGAAWIPAARAARADPASAMKGT